MGLPAHVPRQRFTERPIERFAGAASGTGFEHREIDLRERLADKDARLATCEETIRDLRSRLDAEAEERRRLLALLTGLRLPWWRRWFR